MTLTADRPLAIQVPHVPQDARLVVDPGLLHVEVDADAPFVAGHLSAVDQGKAATIVAYLRERGVLVTASSSGEEILLVISREIAPALFTRIMANAALLRAYLACPQCGQRHSLSPPYGWCWPCNEEARQGERGPCAFVSPTAATSESEEVSDGR
jgi:hypothetical protein